MKYLLTITVFFLIGCSGSSTNENLNDVPQRVISLSPSETEMICAAGACDKLIGRTKFCDYPPEAQQAGIVGVNPLHFEKVLSLSPDVVFIKEGMFSGMEIKKIKEQNIPVIINEYDSIKDVISNLRSIGEQLGAKEKANHIADSLQLLYLKLKEKKYDKRPDVLLLISHDLYIHGGAGYGTELVELAGGRNAAVELNKSFPQVSREYLLTIDPEVIIAGPDFGYEVFFASYPELQNLSAFKTNNLFYINQDLISRPGPRVFTGINKMSKLINE